MRAPRRVVLGKFISFEGPEGAGKSTQIKQLEKYLQDQGHPCVVTKEPGGTAIGQLIRKIVLHRDHHGMAPVCEALLYLADRAQHVHELIRPALDKGTWVLTDRYHDSTRAYQGAARGIAAQQLQAIFALATDNLTPDLTILLDLPPQEGLRRAQRRNVANDQDIAEGRFEAETLAFHQRVRAFFLDLAAAEPNRFVVIDATQSEAQVTAEMLQVVRQRWASQHV